MKKPIPSFKSLGIKPEIIEQIRKNQVLKGKLISLFEISEGTLNRWLNDNYIDLRFVDSIDLIETELKVKDILIY